MSANDARLEQLAAQLAALGVREPVPFRRPDWILEALTHSSYAAEHGAIHNERLEMLGDAVVGLLVADLLFDLYPTAGEGKLTRHRAALVDEAALAERGRRLGLAPLLRLGRGEEASGGRERPALLADAFEALVAALYRTEEPVVLRRLVDALFRADAVNLASSAPQPLDHKTALQEKAQATWKVQPGYRVVEASGPAHDRTFVSEAVLFGIPLGRGTGRTKKAAEQQAAREALAVFDQRRGDLEAARAEGLSLSEVVAGEDPAT